MKIKAWSVNIVWEDGTEEVITDVPNYVANSVDAMCDDLEEDYES